MDIGQKSSADLQKALDRLLAIAGAACSDECARYEVQAALTKDRRKVASTNEQEVTNIGIGVGVLFLFSRLGPIRMPHNNPTHELLKVLLGAGGPL